MDLKIGSTIGDYQVVGVLGAGGMGSVYQVRNLISDRVEALKVLLPDLSGDPSLAERFQREIKVLASLDHPNIAQFRSAFRSGNQILMVMECVEGVTLEHRLKEGPLPVAQALDAIGQVLAALEYAHGRGIVHRDIKPANIVLTPAGVVKLMDFGIAKAATDHRLTVTGTTVGSLYYMSPEQIQGAVTADARSDLYSVGVTLYQLVTGKRPFDGDSQYAIMAAHLEKTPVPPVMLDPRLPQALNDLILMSVAKDPDSRFQTAGAFRNALAAVAATLAPTEAVAAPPPALAPPPPPVRTPFATGSAAVPPVMPPPMPPPMAAAAPPPAPMHPRSMAARPKSHRGLWMAIGGIAAVAAIVCLIEFGPWKGAKAESARQQALATASAQPPATAPVTSAETAPTPPQEAAPQPQPAPEPAPAPKPAVTPKPAARPQEAKPAQAQPAQPQPQQPAPQPEAQQPPPPPPEQPKPEPAPAAPKGPSRQELMKAREFVAKLHFRADAIDNLLQSLKARQEASGMGLNARFTRPQGLMNTYLESADQALNQGDLPAAKGYREKAERQIEILEKLLNM